MSYRQEDTYGRPPPVPPHPPQQGYHQQQQQDQYHHGQNGSYAQQYTQQPVRPYPGQVMYSQYGGPVQQPQPGYSPAQGAYSPSYANPPYRSPQQTYNPQQYSPQVGTGQIPSYNPQAYANTTTTPYPSHYNTNQYSEPTAQATSGPLDDPYGYYHSQSPQQAQSHGSFSPAPTQTHGSFSPAQTQTHGSFSQAQTQTHGSFSPAQTYYTPPLQSSSMSPPPTVSPIPPTHGYAYPPPSQPDPPYRSAFSQSVSPPVPGHVEEAWRPSPPIYSTATRTPQSAFPSPPISTPGPTPPAHSQLPVRTSSNRHPQARPLPGPPEADGEGSYFGGRSTLSREEAEALTQEELFNQVEDAVRNAGRSDTWTPISSAHARTMSQSTYSATSPRHSTGMSNGQRSPLATAAGANDTDDSDAEAAAGLKAMREDDERERAEEARRRSSGYARLSTHGSQRNSHRTSHPLSPPPPPPPPADHPSDSDDYHVDMTSYGGGIDMPLTRVADPNQHVATHDGYGGMSQNGSVRRSHPSQSSRGEPIYTPGSLQSFSPFNLPARVDAGGTGGNYEPRADGRRPSFDEGDEDTFNGQQADDHFPDEPLDIFFPSSSTYRPLPAPPPFPDVWSNNAQGDARAPPPYAPDGYVVDAYGAHVPRSTSLTSHSNTPQVSAPSRSKTDAEERKKAGNRTSGYSSTFDMTPASASAVALDLPSLAAKRFIPSKLGAPDFNKCEEPWALSAVVKWLMQVTMPEQTTELKESAIIEALVNLFTNKVPTMNIADAEALSARVIQEMYTAGALQTTEEWVKIMPVAMSGVIFQLTGTGCYSPTLHDHIVPGRCYSHYCQRTLKKVNLSAQASRSTETWVEFYKLSKEDLVTKDKKEIERQNVLHEIVMTEDDYMSQLNVLRTVYRDPLDTAEPSIITPKRKDNFIKDVFGRVDAVKQANEDHLLPQLKYRQQEQGPWIVGFSDIFRQWIRKAKAAYIDYAGAFPGATFTVRQEVERNLHFGQFLDRAREDIRGHRLGWDTYLKAPITRLQRYTLLLNTVLKNMKIDSEEKTNLQIAYEEVRAVTLECDTRVAEMQRKVDLADLTTKLVLRPGMQSAVELNLNHLGRELIFRGDLQRMGGNRFTWLDSHAILFDHYLVLAKTVTQRADQGGRLDKYDVSRLPIPMDLLAIESTNDMPVQKSSYVKGITTVTAVTARPNEPTQLNKTTSSQSMPTLQHMNTGVSSNSLHTVTSLEGNKDSERILYPFKVKHLGRETYTLFAYSEQSRRDWCTKIIEAKTKHAAALFAQSAEPFRLRVIADSAFVYEPAFLGMSKGVLIQGTPVDRALKEVAHRFKETGRPAPVCRARVNCATSFSTPYPGKQMTAIGTDYGVFVSELDNPRGWTRAITISRVTQIAVLEEFNLFLMIAEKQLIAYNLDIVCPSDANGPSVSNDSARKAPQKLSGHKDVGFFASGKMKDRTLLFYKKRDNMSSTFKVLEPIYQKSSEKKRGMFRRGTTESFREYDEFYIPTECSGINLFHSSLAVSTARGFEVLTLDRKQSVSVPDLLPEHVQNIARHLKDQRALCMLRISDQEFLLCYVNCAVYINKHGDVSRSVIMEFVGTAQAVAMYGAYIILFDNDFVEIRNAQNGRLKQIISGKEIKCLDDGGCWTAGNSTPSSAVNNPAPQRTVKFVMQHPEMDKTQIVVELLLNEGMKE